MKNSVNIPNIERIFLASARCPTLGKKKKDDFTLVRELSNREYQEYSNARIRLVRFSNDQQLFKIVFLNYNDYCNLLEQYKKEFMNNPSLNYSRMERMILNINKHILNYLSATRTYLDHSEANLKRHYGKDSQRVKRFKDACSSAYDNHFSYRFLCGLRNYAQHCEMPIEGLVLSADHHLGNERYSLLATVDRDQLLKKHEWKSQLKKEIQDLPPKFDISPHIDGMMKYLERINLTLIEDDLPELMQNAEYVQQLIAHAKNMPGSPCILKIRESNVSFEWTPLHVVEMVISYSNILKQ